MATVRARRVDANHGAMMERFREMGANVFDCSGLGRGFPDLLVRYGQHQALVEVKDGKKPPSARQLTSDELRFHRDFIGYVVETGQDAEDVMRALGWEGA